MQSTKQAQSYGPSFSNGEGTSTCMSPTLACAQLQNEIEWNRLRHIGGGVERVCPECVVASLAGTAGPIASVLTGPIKLGWRSFASGAGLSLGTNVAADVGLGIPFDIQRASWQAAASGSLNLFMAGPQLTASLSLGGFGTRMFWLPTSVAVGQGVGAAASNLNGK